MIQMSINRGIGKQIVVYLHKRILVSNKNKKTTDARNSISKFQKKNTILSEKSQTQKNIYCIIHLYHGLEQMKLSYGQRNLVSSCPSGGRELIVKGMREFF